MATDVVARASDSQSVDVGLILLSSHTKNLRNGIHSFLALHSKIGVMWRVKYETEFIQA